jgi:hypothetical protein
LSLFLSEKNKYLPKGKVVKMPQTASLCPLIISQTLESFKVLGWCEQMPDLKIDDICRITVEKGVCEIEIVKPPPSSANGESFYQFKGKGNISLGDASSSDGKSHKTRVALLMNPYIPE